MQDKARSETPEFKQYNKQIEEDLKRLSNWQGMTASSAGFELAVTKAQGEFQKDMMAGCYF